MKAKYIITLALASLMVFGCSEDFMEKDDPANVTVDSYYTKEAHADAAVTAIYATLNKQGMFFREMVHWPDQLSDEFFATGFAAGAGLWGSITQHDVTAGGGELGNLWGRLYEGIYAANVAIARIPGIRDTDVSFTEADEKFYMGQAHFLRAYYYFILTNYFGDIIPMNTEIVQSQADFYNAPAAEGEILQLMIDDLQKAQMYLPKVDAYRGTMNMGRATKGAATALLGKLYLYRKDWANASTELAKLINDQATYGTYDLVDYRSLHSGNNENNNESIWEIQFADLGGGDWAAGGDNPTQNEVQYFTTSRSHNRKTDGKHWWNFAIRQDRAYGGRTNATEETGVRSDLWAFENDGTNFIDNRAYATFWGIENGATYTSQQHDAIVLHEGTELNVAGKKELAWFEQSFNPHPVEGYCLGLRKCEVDVGYGFNRRWTNYVDIRYADVLLMYAEARLMQGDEAAAKQYIQMVRDRANEAMNDQPGLPSSSAGTLPNVDQLMADKGWTLTQVLQHERYVELFGEGSRWFDVQRWGITDQVLGYKPGYATMKANDFLLPVPQSEVDNNPNFDGNKANR